MKKDWMLVLAGVLFFLAFVLVTLGVFWLSPDSPGSVVKPQPQPPWTSGNGIKPEYI